MCVSSLVCTGLAGAGLLAGTALAPIEFLGFSWQDLSSSPSPSFFGQLSVQWTLWDEAEAVVVH